MTGIVFLFCVVLFCLLLFFLMVFLFRAEGTQVAGVWSYSYAPDPALSAGWSTAPSVSAEPSPPLISGSNSLPGAEEEQFGVNPGDTLQTFLERLSLSSHLGLFQVYQYRYFGFTV